MLLGPLVEFGLEVLSSDPRPVHEKHTHFLDFRRTETPAAPPRECLERETAGNAPPFRFSSHHRPSDHSSTGPSSSSAVPVGITLSAMSPAFWRIVVSILSAIAGLSRRNCLAFSRP